MTILNQLDTPKHRVGKFGAAFATGWLRRAVLIACFAWLSICVIVVATFDLWGWADPDLMDLRGRLIPPAGWGGDMAHPFGTDELGRDVLSRLIISLRLSLQLALVGTLVGAVLGTLLGFIAAHFKGIVDDILMTAIDIQAAVPFFIIALILIAILGPSLMLFLVLLSLFGWERYARLARAMSLSESEKGYVEAVRGLGANNVRIYLRHILPNVSSALIVNVTLNFPETILLESSLSFLGLGIQPPLSSLGTLLGFGREYVISASWLVLLPALTIFLCTLSVGQIGDWLRDLLDPSLSDTNKRNKIRR